MTRRGWAMVVVVGCGCGGGGGGGSGETVGEASSGGGEGSSGSGTPTSTGELAETGGGASTGSSGGEVGESTGAPTPTSSAGEEASTAGETGAPATSVPVFLAQGHYGRTTISCDDGHTWVQDRSEDDAARCFEDGLDCDHDAFAARGIAWGDEVAVLTWGWGQPGTLVRTEDAATFEAVMTDTPTFADVAYGNGLFVANNSPTQVSDDGGKSWAEGGPLDIGINTRAIEFVAHEAGWFIVAGESGDQRAIVRSADGAAWAPASARPPECGSYTLGLAYGAGVVVMASGSGFVCTSPDGGDTWTQVPISDRLTSPPLWTGAEFFIYEGGTLHRSADGTQWASEPLVGDGVVIGPVARSAEGTFVAANDGWMVWYEQQRFYRSADGVTWETLADGAFVGSHPIYFMAHGRVKPGAGCPG